MAASLRLDILNSSKADVGVRLLSTYQYRLVKR